jgi:flagellar hook-associated protein 2
VDRDNAAIRKKIDDFVSAGNEVLSFIKAEFAPPVDPKKPHDTNRSLFGDSTLKSLKRKIHELISAAFASPAATPNNSFADIGITTDRAGLITVDGVKLDQKLALDSQNVEDIFVGTLTTTGIMDRFVTDLDPFEDAIDGSIPGKQSQLNKNITRMNDQMERMERNVEALRVRLTKQFAAMEAIVSRLQSQGSFLSAQSNAFRLTR